MDDWNLNEKSYTKWQYLQHYTSIMSQKNYEAWQIILDSHSVSVHRRFTISVEQEWSSSARGMLNRTIRHQLHKQFVCKIVCDIVNQLSTKNIHWHQTTSFRIHPHFMEWGATKYSGLHSIQCKTPITDMNGITIYSSMNSTSTSEFQQPNRMHLLWGKQSHCRSLQQSFECIYTST